MLAKLCEECIKYVSSACNGKDEAEHKTGGKPCKKYVFASDGLISELDNEPTDEQLKDSEAEMNEKLAEEEALEPEPEPDGFGILPGVKIGVPSKARKNVKGGAKSVDTRHANFQRLSAARINKAITAIKLLANLSNKYAYAYEPVEVQALRTMLEKTISDVFSQF